MAVKNIDNYVNGDGFGLPLNIRRGNPNPLDNSYLWNSYAEMALYAATSPIAYVGQLVAAYEDLVQDDGSTVETVCLYIILNEDGDLLPVANLKTANAIETNLEEIKKQIDDVTQKQEETSQKQEEIIQKQEEQQQKQEEIIQKQEEHQQKQEEIVQKQEELTQKQEETSQKQEEIQQKQEEIVQKQEEQQQKQEEIIQKQEEQEKAQEEIKKEQEEIKQNVQETVEKVVEEQSKENTTIKQEQTEIKDTIGATTDPDTGESKLPENAEDIVDAINKVNDKIVDPREEDDQWATKEDIDNLYEDLFGDLGW